MPSRHFVSDSLEMCANTCVHPALGLSCNTAHQRDTMTTTTYIHLFLAEAAAAVAIPSCFWTGGDMRRSNDAEALAGRHAS